MIRDRSLVCYPASKLALSKPISLYIHFYNSPLPHLIVFGLSPKKYGRNDGSFLNWVIKGLGASILGIVCDR